MFKSWRDTHWSVKEWPLFINATEQFNWTLRWAFTQCSAIGTRCSSRLIKRAASGHWWRCRELKDVNGCLAVWNGPTAAKWPNIELTGVKSANWKQSASGWVVTLVDTAVTPKQRLRDPRIACSAFSWKGWVRDETCSSFWGQYKRDKCYKSRAWRHKANIDRPWDTSEVDESCDLAAEWESSHPRAYGGGERSASAET